MADCQVFFVQEKNGGDYDSETVLAVIVKDSKNVWIDMFFDLDKVKIVVV